ncbi:MAG: Ferric reductase domain protein transmembrane component domain-containing protein [candidate division WS6 bacterium GW2011_GWF2_39_15]|uniref:Ferric reductase domain protein transmembrane component domain-containing protein n=1 Tax=candidate division WS6 bacterium GW2011_GWF2_39_15 TaxID=1619100 RepID=A0A0G0MNT3_9BACT|nr:MAG: Ferric reductase domain protein transmembrane component domain-containing protein [candidate division WS6 bacterium GW2011_GWF2_39_15]
MKRLFSTFLIFVFLVVTVILWVWAKKYIGEPTPLILGGAQISALLAVTLLSLEYIIATRLRIVEVIFDGLDNAYIAHHIIGGFAFVLILTHPLLLIINSIPSIQGFYTYLLPSSNLAYTFGILALYCYTIILLVTFYAKIPYSIWATIHKFIGIPMLLVMIHVLLISSDISVYPPLAIWIFSLVGIALISAVYKRFLYRLLSVKYRYRVSHTRILGEVIEIYMLPVKEKVSFLPGQFIYVRFFRREIGSEQHPFSISSGINTDELRISVKMDGDSTWKYMRLESGDEVELQGPHGKFGESLLSDQKDAIWVAGGIGITPFLSLLDYESVSTSHRKVSLYYTVKNHNEAVYITELAQKALRKNTLRVYPNFSESSGRLEPLKVVQNEGLDRRSLGKMKVFLCGPSSMMESMTIGFINLGIKPWNIIKEDFYIK